ncbi:uncharacterized protein LOC135376675 [Ornithodoros turicata]|uniref:uncharacterized protein LOC135376675 n=1 Tax=Ornithodoros turicata TaxID=34597 RepID=UPI00313869DD
MHQDALQLSLQTLQVTRLLQALGFQVNSQKSQTLPCQALTFLGFIIDTQIMRIQLPLEKKEQILAQIRFLLTTPRIPPRELCQIVGKLNATVLAVFPAPLHYRALQRLRRVALRRGSYDVVVSWTPAAMEELRWREKNLLHCNGRPLHDDKIALVIQSDSSLLRWGAVCRGVYIGQPWPPQDRALHINELELKAAILALQTFARGLKQGCVLIQMDNTVAITAISKLGSARSLTLSSFAHQMWSWCFQKGLTVRAEHIPGRRNIQADWASRVDLDSSSWKLDPCQFNKISYSWGPFQTDLFADFTNFQIPHFYSWKPDPCSQGIDAFTKDWNSGINYAFPPFCLVGKCIQKIQQATTTLVLIAPVWPAQTWYPSLLQALVDQPRLIPHHPQLLLNNAHLGHPLILSGGLRLAAWKVSSNTKLRSRFRLTLPHSSVQHGVSQQERLI